MLSYSWKILSSTEDDFIEYQRCIEVLEGAGFSGEEVDARALNCSTCHLSGRCPTASIPCEFLGARTC